MSHQGDDMISGGARITNVRGLGDERDLLRACAAPGPEFGNNGICDGEYKAYRCYRSFQKSSHQQKFWVSPAGSADCTPAVAKRSDLPGCCLVERIKSRHINYHLATKASHLGFMTQCN
ncbi:hypothetical protein V2G26_018531 [Clonostachys chloroleuca]